MFPYIIKGGLLTYDYFAKMFTTPGPANDPFVTLYASNGHHDISSLVCTHYQYAKNSPADLRAWALTYRYPVPEVGIHKILVDVEHESVALWAKDMGKDMGCKSTPVPMEFIVDRVPSTLYASRFSSFSNYSFNDSSVVFDTIQSTIRNMPSITADSLLAAINKSTERDSDSDTTIPLLPLSSPSIPSTPLPLKDRISLTLAQAMATARSASQSISPRNLASDSIRGYPPGSLLPKNCIITFKPVGLYIFDVILIAQIVHVYAPMYGLFDNQCYMFARVVFDVIVQLFSFHKPALEDDPSIHRTPVPAPSREVDLPANANVVVVPSPDQAGRWAGLLIVDPVVRSTIVSIVVAQYKIERPLYDV